MNARRFLLSAAAAAFGAIAAQAAVPTVSDVTISQSGHQAVTITYRLSGDPGIVTLEILNNGEPIGGENVTFVRGDVNKLVQPTAAGEVRTIQWQAEKSWPQQMFANAAIAARVTAWTTNAPPDVLVVDLSDGAMRYYTDESYLPYGGLTNDLYRLSQMVFRRIPAAGVTATLGSKGKEYAWQQAGTGQKEAQHDVTFTKDFYMGVFEVTQGQWSKVYSRNYSSFSHIDYAETRPAELISFGNLRGAWWTPGNNVAPKSDTFIDRLRTLTGADFDLPTECQWEFAAHGGDTNTFYNGHTYYTEQGNGGTYADLKAAAEANLSLLGRWQGNGGQENGLPNGSNSADNSSYTTERGTTRVGSYLPSAYGLYDILGNVREMCREPGIIQNSQTQNHNKREWIVNGDLTVSSQAYGAETVAAISDYTTETGNAVLTKGGSWQDAWYICRPSYASTDFYEWEGMPRAGCRLILEIPQP